MKRLDMKHWQWMFPGQAEHGDAHWEYTSPYQGVYCVCQCGIRLVLIWTLEWHNPNARAEFMCRY